MITIVYLSNRIIQVVVGNEGTASAQVKEAYEVEAPENSLINGVVTAPEELADCLSAFWKEKRLPKKNVRLVLNSSQFSTKVITTPILGSAKMYRNVAREFNAAEPDQALCGYYRLTGGKKKGMCEVFASMMEQSFLEVYRKLFDSIGVELVSVEAALGCAVNLLGRSDRLKGKAAIVQILDEHNLTSVLMNDGRYIYSTVNRLFSERGSEGFGREVARSISGITQFVSAQKIEGQIRDIYWAGFTSEEQKLCADSILQDSGQLALHELGQEKMIRMGSNELRFSDWIYPVSALLKTQNEYNQLICYKQVSPEMKKRMALFKMLTPVIAVLAMCLIATAGLAITYQVIHAGRVKAEEYNTRQSVLEQVAEYDRLSSKNISNQARLASINRAAGYIASYPYLNSRVNHAFFRCSSGLAGETQISIKSFSAETGIVQIDASAAEVAVIHQFIENLGLDPYFSEIDYSGYTYSETEGSWTINLICYLSAEAGK